MGQLIKEVFELPPEINTEAERLTQLIASMFGRSITGQGFLPLTKKYWNDNAPFFSIKRSNKGTSWGGAQYEITSKSGLYSPVYLCVTHSDDDATSGYIHNDGEAIYIKADEKHFTENFKTSVDELRETIKHELRHYVQIKQKVGFPRRKLMSKTYNIHGFTDDPRYKRTRQPHHLRDIEFKTNLHSYAYYIKRSLQQSLDKGRWADQFRKIITGQYDGDDRIKNFSDNLIDMAKRDPTRWKQFVLELWKLVFSSKKNVDEIRSPYEKPSLTDKNRGYIGIVSHNRVYGYEEEVPNVYEVDHSEIEYGANDGRFRYVTEGGIVYWNHFPPTDEEREVVEEWLGKKNIKVNSHRCAYTQLPPLPPIIKPHD